MASQPKIHEVDIVVPALRYLSRNPDGLTSRELKERLVALFQPSGINARLNANGDSAFMQIVGNIVSNRFIGNNMINRGFAKYNGRRILITEDGRALLRDIGY